MVLAATNVFNKIEEVIVFCAVEDCIDVKALAFTLVGPAVEGSELNVVRNPVLRRGVEYA